MRVQTRTLQVPRIGAGAFSPGLTQGGAPATGGINRVTGSPGTQPVPSPRPPAMKSAWGGLWQPSAVAPDVIYPSIYVSHADGCRFPGAVVCDNAVPVPAVVQGRSAIQSQHRTRVGGRTTTSSLRPFTTWPTYARSGTGS